MDDSMLEREIEALLAAEPSADFRARVRQRIGQEPPLTPHAIRWRLVWALAAGSVVAATAVLLVTMPLTERAIGPVADIHARSLNLPLYSAAAPVHAMRSVAGARPPRTARPDMEVIVDASEALALRRWLNDVASGQTRLAAIRTPALSAEALSDEFGLPPIVIEPLVSPNEEGVQP